MTHYHQTTALTGIDPQTEELNAYSQEQIVLGMYYIQSKPMTANDVFGIWSHKLQAIGRPVPPITSVRRALSNLKTQGLLAIQTTHKPGSYGKPVHFYEITPQGLAYAERHALHSYLNAPKPNRPSNNQLNLF